MIRPLAKLLKLVAVLLVTGMIFQAAAAAAHSAFCPDEDEQATIAGEVGDMIADSEMAASSGHAHDGTPGGPQGSAAACHSVFVDCSGCMAEGATGLAALRVGRVAFLYAADSFSPIQPGAAHRPPITAS